MVAGSRHPLGLSLQEPAGIEPWAAILLSRRCTLRVCTHSDVARYKRERIRTSHANSVDASARHAIAAWAHSHVTRKVADAFACHALAAYSQSQLTHKVVRTHLTSRHSSVDAPNRIRRTPWEVDVSNTKHNIHQKENQLLCIMTTKKAWDKHPLPVLSSPSRSELPKAVREWRRKTAVAREPGPRSDVSTVILRPLRESLWEQNMRRNFSCITR